MAGIDNIIKTINGVRELALDGIVLAKEGIGLRNLGKALEVLSDFRLLVDVGPKALPEMQDLDGPEAAQVGAAAYVAVKDVLNALGSLKK